MAAPSPRGSPLLGDPALTLVRRLVRLGAPFASFNLSFQVTHQRELYIYRWHVGIVMVSSLQICCDGWTISPLETGVQPIQVSPLSLSRFLADRTCSTSRYISSRLAAFPPCSFPHWVSPLGRAGVLRGILLSTSYPFWGYLTSAEAAHPAFVKFLLAHLTTPATHLAAIFGIDLEDGMPSFFRFVRTHAHKFAPPSIGKTFV